MKSDEILVGYGIVERKGKNKELVIQKKDALGVTQRKIHDQEVINQIRAENQVDAKIIDDPYIVTGSRWDVLPPGNITYLSLPARQRLKPTL